MPDQFGTYFYSKSFIYKGRFDNGKRNGYGEYTLKNKIISSGIFWQGDIVEAPLATVETYEYDNKKSKY